MIPLKDNIPTERFPVITIALILINVLMYFGFQHGGILKGPSDTEVVKYGAIPYEITHPGKHCGIGTSLRGGGTLTGPASGGIVVCEGEHVQTDSGKATVRRVAGKQPSTWLTVLTSMFMHGSIIHLLGNMLFLWIFGNNVEDSMNRLLYVVFYLLGGLVALGLQIGVSPNAAVPTVGASGAIAAVLGGYILLFPRARVLTLIFIVIFFTIIELPAVVILGLWFLEQILFGAGNLTNPVGGGGGVAYFAHIGGFAFGLLTIRAFARRRDRNIPPAIPVY